jgi:hypothetical protein
MLDPTLTTLLPETRILYAIVIGLAATSGAVSLAVLLSFWRIYRQSTARATRIATPEP